MKNNFHTTNPLVIIFILSPALVFFLCWMMPTHDDWSYFTTPFYDFGNRFTNRLIPWASYWRPFDALLGYVLSLKPGLFPTLNHIVVYAGHVMATCCVYVLSSQLGFSRLGRNVATAYFFLSPGMLGTVLGIDSANQAYAAAWGLAGTIAYLHADRPWCKAAWLACTVMATFSKENGIAFLVIPQLLAWGYGRRTLRSVARDTAVAAALGIAYAAARMVLTTDVVRFSNDYFDNSPARKLKNVAVLLGMTWMPVDFVSLVYPPTRNIPVAAASLIAGMPLVAAVFGTARREWLSRPVMATAVCWLAAESPHLLTLLTAMHPYAGLGLAALLTGHLTSKSCRPVLIRRLLPPFVLACAFIGWHHWQASYESGLRGQAMARQAIAGTGCPIDSAYIIRYDQDEPKYSSFCVIAYDAFGWGTAAYAATGYKWPTDIKDTTLWHDQHLPFNVDSIADAAIRHGYKTVWYVHGDTLDVVRRPRPVRPLPRQEKRK